VAEGITGWGWKFANGGTSRHGFLICPAFDRLSVWVSFGAECSGQMKGKASIDPKCMGPSGVMVGGGGGLVSGIFTFGDRWVTLATATIRNHFIGLAS
jgi:hypothetical protein